MPIYDIGFERSDDELSKYGRGGGLHVKPKIFLRNVFRKKEKRKVNMNY